MRTLLRLRTAICRRLRGPLGVCCSTQLLCGNRNPLWLFTCSPLSVSLCLTFLLLLLLRGTTTSWLICTRDRYLPYFWPRDRVQQPRQWNCSRCPIRSYHPRIIVLFIVYNCLSGNGLRGRCAAGGLGLLLGRSRRRRRARGCGEGRGKTGVIPAGYRGLRRRIRALDCLLRVRTSHLFFT